MTMNYLFALVLALVVSTAHAENWLQWRGPSFNGSTTETNVPTNLDKLLWSVETPGIGAGTPVVFNDRLFISAQQKGTLKLMALCYSIKDGKLLWQHEIGSGLVNRQNSMASPSAVTDGKNVFYLYGTGDFAGFTIDGKLLWQRNLQKDYGTFNMNWLYGSSPLLYKGRLYVPVLHRNVPVANWKDPLPGEKLSESYLLCVEPVTGKTLWRHVRPNNAKAESQESYITPIPHEYNGRSELLLIAGDCITGHDPETGKEFWRFGGWNPENITSWRLVPSALVAGDRIIVCTPKAAGIIIAIKSGGTGDITKTHEAWRTTDIRSDVPVPLYYQNNLYVLDGDFKKGLSCMDPATGQRKWFTPIESKSVLRTSPTGADGRIYFMSEAGDVWIVSAADGAILAKASLGGADKGKLTAEDKARASIVPAQGYLFVRTAGKLYAFGK